jgi:hypothetical protein
MCLPSSAAWLRGSFVALGAFLFLTIAGCRLGLPEDEEEEMDVSGFLDRLQGAWQTDCSFVETTGEDDDVWRIIRYDFDGDRIDWRQEEHDESTCSEAESVLVYGGEVAIGDEVDGEDGQAAREIDIRYEDSEVLEGSADPQRVPFRRYDNLHLTDDDRRFFLG